MTPFPLRNRWTSDFPGGAGSFRPNTVPPKRTVCPGGEAQIPDILQNRPKAGPFGAAVWLLARTSSAWGARDARSRLTPRDAHAPACTRSWCGPSEFDIRRHFKPSRASARQQNSQLLRWLGISIDFGWLLSSMSHSARLWSLYNSR